MRQAFRFVAVLVAGLAACSILAHIVLVRMTRHWFETDLATRADFVRNGALPLLTGSEASEDRKVLSAKLAEIVRDQRLMAAQVCTAEGGTLARSARVAEPVSCRALPKYLSG